MEWIKIKINWKLTHKKYFNKVVVISYAWYLLNTSWFRLQCTKWDPDPFAYLGPFWSFISLAISPCRRVMFTVLVRHKNVRLCFVFYLIWKTLYPDLRLQGWRVQFISPLYLYCLFKLEYNVKVHSHLLS